MDGVAVQLLNCSLTSSEPKDEVWVLILLGSGRQNENQQFLDGRRARREGTDSSLRTRM